MTNPTPQDREMAKGVGCRVCADTIEEYVAEIIATARLQGRREALEEAARVAEEQAKVFASDEYATGQPLSSFGERFACGRIAEEIRKLGKA